MTSDKLYPTFDSDGYPTEETERTISEWSYKDYLGWIEYIKEAWNHNYGKNWEEDGFLKFSTGGWSGNESIIAAMKDNNILWSMNWESSHRGGLLVLRVPKEKLK